jgi:hypothetical protein
LVIAERAEHRLLVRLHVEIEWPEAIIVEHCLGEDIPLDPQFAATGFDAVVIVGAAPSTSAETSRTGRQKSSRSRGCASCMGRKSIVRCCCECFRMRLAIIGKLSR